VRRWVRDDTFTLFKRTPASDRHTEGQIHGHCIYSASTAVTRRPASADRTARRQFQFQYLCISRVHLFHDIQWKRIRGIPFIVKSQNNTDTTNQNTYFKPSIHVNLIYNTYRNNNC